MLKINDLHHYNTPDALHYWFCAELERDLKPGTLWLTKPALRAFLEFNLLRMQRKSVCPDQNQKHHHRQNGGKDLFQPSTTSLKKPIETMLIKYLYSNGANTGFKKRQSELNQTGREHCAGFYRLIKTNTLVDAKLFQRKNGRSGTAGQGGTQSGGSSA